MKRMFCLLIPVMLLGVCISGVCLAQKPAANAPAKAVAAPDEQTAKEVAAIRATSEAFVAAFNKGDAKAIAGMWTENGEYVDDAGQRVEGRAAIEKIYTEIFAASPGAKIEIAVDSIRLLSPTAAIEDGRANMEPKPAGVVGSGQYTATHVKVGGTWLMASVRDAWIQTPATVTSAADLEWLIGTWVAEENGVKTESVCSWVASGRFVERTSTTTQVDGTTTSGKQLIGWNPLEGHVQSWTFSPDGGHAVGNWMPIPGGWMAHLRGTTGEGIATTSINYLVRLDDNAYAWQSVHRIAGSAVLSDTDEVIWKRQPVKK